MKKISCVLAALATIAIVAPAAAEDKPMMKEGMRGDAGMHHRMHHSMGMQVGERHHDHHMIRHAMRKAGM